MKIENLTINQRLNNITLEFSKGKITNLLGQNGSGKTTFLKCLSGLIEYEGNITNSQKIGLVFQNPEDQFIRYFVEDDLAFSLEQFDLTKKEIKQKIYDIAKEFQIVDLLKKPTIELSGGEKQKVAIIGNLLTEPDVLLLDESFEMIDSLSTKNILQILKSYIKRKNLVCIHVTHNLNLISYDDDVCYLKKGYLKYIGKSENFWKEKELIKEEQLQIPIYKKLEEILNITIKDYQDMEELLCKLN